MSQSAAPTAADRSNASKFDLRGMAWIVRVLRTIGVIICVLMAVVARDSLGPAKLAILLALAATLALLEARFFWRSTRVEVSDVGPALLIVVFCEALAIVCTGGINSPIVIATLPLSIIVGFLRGARWRWFPLVLVALIWTLLGAESVPLLRAFLAEPTLGATRSATSQWVFSAVLTFIILGGNQIGRLVRAMLDASSAKLAMAQDARMAELALAHADLNELTGRLAHELKNPLTTLLSLSTYLQRTLPPSLAERETRVLVEELRRMRQTVDRMLGAADLSRGSDVDEFDLHSLCQNVLRRHAVITTERGVSMEVIGTSAWVAGSARELTTVLDNLIQNALEATPAGKTIALVVDVTDSRARVEVRDEGQGIASGAHERLFTPGFTTKSKGNGVGLAISRSIVLRHGGRLDVVERDGGGCIARVELPLAARG